MGRKIAIVVITITFALIMGSPNAAAFVNLLQNPGAETGGITGWTVVNPPETGSVSAQTLLGVSSADPGPHSGTYLFRSDNSTPTNSACTWYISQVIDVTGLVSYPFSGYVWGATNSTEHVRLIVSQHYDSTWTNIYDSNWVRSDRTWTQLSFGPILLNPSTYEVKFKMGAYKPANVGQANNSGLDDAYLQAAIPEPASMLLFGIGVFGFGFVRRKKI